MARPRQRSLTILVAILSPRLLAPGPQPNCRWLGMEKSKHLSASGHPLARRATSAFTAGSQCQLSLKARRDNRPGAGACTPQSSSNTAARSVTVTMEDRRLAGVPQQGAQLFLVYRSIVSCVSLNCFLCIAQLFLIYRSIVSPGVPQQGAANAGRG